jgi:hypothetical protein
METMTDKTTAKTLTVACTSEQLGCVEFELAAAKAGVEP